MTFDLRPLEAWIVDVFEPAVRDGQDAGDYSRRVGGEFVELYGIADMACILYTLGRLTPDDKARSEWIRRLQSFQDPESGFLLAKTAYLSKVHNTAFALGALNLFDALPSHPLAFARNFDTPQKMEEYIASRDWHRGVYLGGEDVVGLASSNRPTANRNICVPRQDCTILLSLSKAINSIALLNRPLTSELSNSPAESICKPFSVS